jgi:hypothetical protein
MNIPNTMIRNAISRRGSMRSAGAAGAAIMLGGAVVASAMLLMPGRNVLLRRAPPDA